MQYSSRSDIIGFVEKKVLENICMISYDNKNLFNDIENKIIQKIIKNLIELQKSLSEKK